MQGVQPNLPTELVSSKSLAQGSEAWLQARLGRVTASRVADVVAKTRSGWGASRANYAAELVVERLTGKPIEAFVSKAMQDGIENEPLARIAYELYVNIDVEQVGFIPHPTIAMVGCSPDGIVDSDGLVEIKCPQRAAHLNTLRGSAIDERYLLQMQLQMACTKRLWCDFVSFNPDFPEEMRLFVKRVPRDNRRIAELEEEVELFLHEVEATVTYLRHKYQKDAA